MSAKRKKHLEDFFVSIVRASNHAASGSVSGMKRHISDAKKHHKNYLVEHEKIHGREAAEKEHHVLNQYYDKLKGIYESKPFKEKVEKSESLKKGVGPKKLSTEGNKYPSGKEMTVKPPGQDRRYTYKPFNELTPDQQSAAKQKFAGATDIESHHYPLHEDGTVAHAARWKDTKAPKVDNSNLNSKPSLVGNAPRANSGMSNSDKAPSVSTGTLAHHQPDSAVRISSEGHEHHGNLGRVRTPNPYYPNKIHVEVNKRGGGTKSVFLDPHEVAPNKMEKSDNVIDLTKAVLEKIKKRG
jgi:hypothetical protein